MSHDYSPLFLRYINGPTKKGSTGWQECQCPWPQNHKHGDKSWSFGFNPEQGTFKCHGCGTGGGPADFVGYMEVPGYSGDSKDHKRRAVEKLREILRQLGIEDDRDSRPAIKEKPKAELPSDAVITQWQEALSQEDELLRYLTHKRFWSEREISDRRIGFDKGRYMIPIYRGGELVNVRRYKPGADRAKMIGIAGRNSPALFPWTALDKDALYLLEGEPDVMAARSVGLNAATFTGGAGQFEIGDLAKMRGKSVAILYDADDAGVSGAQKVAAALRRYTSKVKIVDFAQILDGEDGKDFTDLCRAVGPQESLRRCVAATRATPWYEPDVDNDERVFEPTIEDAVTSYYVGRRIKVRAIVAGISEKPFAVQTKAKMSCPIAGTLKKCEFCSLANGDTIEWELDKASEEPLRFANKPEASRLKSLMAKADINCSAFQFKSQEAQTLEMVILIPPVTALTDVSRETISVSAVQSFVFMDSTTRLKINQMYDFTGTAVVSPIDSRVELIFLSAEECEGDLETFQMSAERAEKHVEAFDESGEVVFL